MAKILVIEDDKTTGRMVEKFLTDGGHTVTLTENGKAGLKSAASDPPDLVITDIFMPEKDGLEALRELRARRADLPILAISGGGAGASGAEILRMARILGATDVLRKPVTSSELREAVAKCLKI